MRRGCRARRKTIEPFRLGLLGGGPCGRTHNYNPDVLDRRCHLSSAGPGQAAAGQTRMTVGTTRTTAPRYAGGPPLDPSGSREPAHPVTKPLFHQYVVAAPLPVLKHRKIGQMMKCPGDGAPNCAGGHKQAVRPRGVPAREFGAPGSTPSHRSA